MIRRDLLRLARRLAFTGIVVASVGVVVLPVPISIELKIIAES